MANKRVFYACQAVTFAGFNEANNARQGNHFPAKGVQSVGITTSFNLEQIFEENIFGVLLPHRARLQHRKSNLHEHHNDA